MNTERDQSIATRYRDGESSLDIAGTIGISDARVRQILERDGVPRRPGGRQRRVDHGALVAMYRQATYQVDHLAEHFDCSENLVRQILRRAGFNMGRQPFTDPDVIVRLYTVDGLMQSEIAEKMDIAQATVSKWIVTAGLTYKDRGRGWAPSTD